jgi:hypothetical protein
MIVSRAIAIACLTFLVWALVFVAGLLLVLIVVQEARGDAAARPLAHASAAIVALVIALICRALAGRLA